MLGAPAPVSALAKSPAAILSKASCETDASDGKMLVSYLNVERELMVIQMLWFGDWWYKQRKYESGTCRAALAVRVHLQAP